MQHEIVFKGDRWCSCYTCLPQSSHAAQTALKMAAAPGTGTPPKDQRLLTIATPKQSPAHTHTCKQRQKLRNNTSLHKNNAQNGIKTILCITTIVWARKPPKTELEREN